jgi:hypothetical protein
MVEPIVLGRGNNLEGTPLNVKYYYSVIGSTILQKANAKLG